jgi:hypothetical protein
MMSCVNRDCSRPLASFSDGRLFHFEILSISVSADDNKRESFDEVPHRAGVQFWLCGSCSATMTLAMEPVGGLRLVPLEQSMGRMMESSGATFHELQGARAQG